ncbi:MAG: NUDIX hydrolase [Phycisphaerae bacterium]|nr:NUDIX hydrolase [Phycisphaerae bacterium]MDW8262188.1 NUDIX hydrolase [Phycisphaerales bacterium]
MAHKLLERQVLFEGKKVRLEVHRLEDEHGIRFSAEVCTTPGAVVVIPFLDEQRIVLIRTYRHAIRQYLMELPAGTLMKDEAPMNAAGRELLEETGYLARRLQAIMTFFASPGVLSERMHVFAAYSLEPRQAAPEAGESIEVCPTALDEAIQMIRDGQIQDAKTIAALLSYDRWWRERPGKPMLEVPGTAESEA